MEKTATQPLSLGFTHIFLSGSGRRTYKMMECSSPGCDNAECGDTPEEAARLWNFANPDWSGNVPVR